MLSSYLHYILTTRMWWHEQDDILLSYIIQDWWASQSLQEWYRVWYSAAVVQQAQPFSLSDKVIRQRGDTEKKKDQSHIKESLSLIHIFFLF